MIPRLLILIGLVLAGFSALFYLVTRVHRFRFSLALARGRHGWSWVISVLAVLLLAVCLFLFIFLLCAMGHKEGVDGIYQCWLNRIPLDLFALLLIFLFYAWATFVSEIWYINGWYYILLILGTAALALTLILSVAGRAKAPGFFKNTIVYMVFAWIFRGLGRIPMVWRTMLIWAGFCFIDLLLMFDGSSAAALWWLFSRGVLTVGILYLASSLKILQKEGQAIADGQTDYKGKPIPRWLPALKKHEENLQSIRSGIQKAVDEQTRAERMKTELITNVSHDIKTPLTSIVNYVDLLEKEDIQPEKAKEYVDVLHRQSARLKKLTEDLVEASKASSGCLPVHLARTDVNVLISQLAGDYMEKLEAAQLEPVFRPAPSQPVIQADGQLLSRVLGNLFANICKYALPGTRVYFESAADDETVSITFKNISKYELNIPAEDTKKLVPQIADFMKQRLRNMLMDQGIRYDVVDAVLADQMNDDFTDLVARAKALNSFVASAEAPALIQAATRVANLCKKIEEESAINPQLFAVEAEGALHNAAMAASKEVLVAATKYDYAAVMAEAVKLVDPINKFFEDVMVMDEDVRVKNNRLALLAAVKDITHAVGDLSVIVQ